MTTYIVTGGNRGLGFEIARQLAVDSNARVVIAVRDLERGRAAAGRIGANVEALALDLASRHSVDRFVSRWKEPIAGLVNNAGVQFADATRYTEDGMEETFVVNHLNALRLTLGLEEALQGGRVMFIGSGTHNPRHPTARPFGFRGERFESVADCAAGLHGPGKVGQLGRDRYATTKFMNMVATVELARRHDPQKMLFICLDPGLMPGTDLARTAPAFLKFGWYFVLPILAKALPDSSTPERSGKAARELLTRDPTGLKPGGIYSYDGKLSTRVADRVFDEELGRRIVNESMELIGSRPTGEASDGS